jgi:Ca2+-binding RTX toxin-like protein
MAAVCPNGLDSANACDADTAAVLADVCTVTTLSTGDEQWTCDLTTHGDTAPGAVSMTSDLLASPAWMAVWGVEGTGAPFCCATTSVDVAQIVIQGTSQSDVMEGRDPYEEFRPNHRAGLITTVFFEAGDGDDVLMTSADYSPDVAWFVEGEAGHDRIQVRSPVTAGMSSNTHVYGGSDDDTIQGCAGDDLLFGDGGNDLIFAGAGDDILGGGGGKDELYGEDDNDLVYGDGGRDTIAAGAGDDTVFGGQGSDRIAGGSGNDVLRGGRHNDVICGDGGNDDLFGDGEDDVLWDSTVLGMIIGGPGFDRCSPSTGCEAVGPTSRPTACP